MDNSDAAAAFGVGFVIVYLMVVLASIAFGVYLYTRVAKKAGWPWAYGLLMFVPVANIVFMIMFVFMKWPIEAEVEALRAQVQALGGQNWYQQGPQAPYGAPSAQAQYGAPAGPSLYGAPAGPSPYGAPAGPPVTPGSDTSSWLPPTQDEGPTPSV
jgi:heme/copper-type cytochrome/quinol oxidase subunit 4